MLIVEKAWKSVIQTTIFNCFRKSGFCVNTPDEELQVVQPTPWESHPVIGDVPFEDFVQVDDGVAVWGTLDILAAKDEEQPDVDNDEEDQEFPPVTLKEASTSLEKLRHFSLQVGDVTDSTLGVHLSIIGLSTFPRSVVLYTVSGFVTEFTIFDGNSFDIVLLSVIL
ncbi:hypothetical protein J6590_106240 [Homalodisca vitripennis]|nr:hypothetical protein J6590_106240 [Homalodisca vitripennis]